MQIRYYIDPATDLPHIYNHDVSEQEVEDILARPLQDMRGREDSRIALGQTEEGRYVKVIYVPDPIPESVKEKTMTASSTPADGMKPGFGAF